MTNCIYCHVYISSITCYLFNMKSLTFSNILSVKQRYSIFAISFVSTIFLTFYTQLVCPFLDSLPFMESFRNLLIVFFFQLLLREGLLYFTKVNWEISSMGKSLYRSLVYSWIISGIFAMILHEFLYNNINPNVVTFSRPWPSDYPWHSHLKVLSGYWFLGAGLLAQLELTLGEGFIRQFIQKNIGNKLYYFERIASRITLGNFFYAFVPSVAVLIMVIRYAIQDKIIPLGITLEIAYIGAIFIGTAVWAAFLYGRVLREDTRKIVEAIQQIGDGDFNVALIPTRQDELGQVAGGVNKMAAGLIQRERIKESFGYFVSPEIAEKFVSQYSEGRDMRNQGERRTVAVLMCDIRNFSSISDTMDPTDVAQMLNNYFDHMVHAIEANGGLVDKFIGDAIMAVFGLLDTEHNHALQAANAAIAMRSALKDANHQNQEQGLPILEHGIGIHYGEIIASYLGSSRRLEFTVIGSTVNIAARLESQAKKPNPPIIISEAMAHQIKHHHGILSGGSVELKGVGKQRLFSIEIPS